MPSLGTYFPPLKLPNYVFLIVAVLSNKQTVFNIENIFYTEVITNTALCFLQTIIVSEPLPAIS